MDVIIFEDNLAGQNRPATLGRPAFGVTCGVACLYDQARSLGFRVRTVMRDYLRPVFARRFPSEDVGAGPTLFLNAALTPDIRLLRRIAQHAAEGTPFLIPSGERVAAAFATSFAEPEDGFTPENVAPLLLESKPPLIDEDAPTIDHPFDIVKQHLAVFEANLADRIERGSYERIAENVYVGSGVRIAPTAVLKAEDGPIVLEDNVTVMDFAYLSGPIRVGRRSKVIERSSVKEDTCVGHTCKIGGEVEAAVIEPYTNKQHHGFLGHAWIGSWVNMGAGTSNSDLKNTYGPVRVEIDGQRVDTGMQFFGCVIGDYSKTAINTSILTGKIVGVASMLYGFVSTNAPSFCNYARTFGQMTEVDIDTAVEAQRRMFLRRDVDQTPEHVQLLRAMHDLTRDERRLAAQQVAL